MCCVPNVPFGAGACPRCTASCGIWWTNMVGRKKIGSLVPCRVVPYPFVFKLKCRSAQTHLSTIGLSPKAGVWSQRWVQGYPWHTQRKTYHQTVDNSQRITDIYEIHKVRGQCSCQNYVQKKVFLVETLCGGPFLFRWWFSFALPASREW